MFKWLLGIDIDIADDLGIGAGVYIANLLTKGDDWGIWFELHLLFIHIVIGKAPADFMDMGMK